MILGYFAVSNYTEALKKDLDRIKSEHDSAAAEIAGAVSGKLLSGDLTAGLKILESFSGKGRIGYAVLFDANGEYIDGFAGDRIVALLPGHDLKPSEISPKGLATTLSRNLQGDLHRIVDIVSVKFAKRGDEARNLLGGVEVCFFFPFGKIQGAVMAFAFHIQAIIVFFAVLLLISGIISFYTRTKLPPPQRQTEAMPAAQAQELQQIGEPYVVELEGEPSAPEEDAKDIFSVDFASYKYDTEETKEINIDKAQGWIQIFNGYDIDDWEKEGMWYVGSNHIVGVPWRASLVRYDIKDLNYEFKFRAKKISGRDGFVALFKTPKKCHAWVIGGWNGTRSEVVRIAQTVTHDRIERDKWYDVRICAVGLKIEGFLNDRNVWSVYREVFENAPSQDIFLDGVGFGLWNTVCKFTDVQIKKR